MRLLQHTQRPRGSFPGPLLFLGGSAFSTLSQAPQMRLSEDAQLGSPVNTVKGIFTNILVLCLFFFTFFLFCFTFCTVLLDNSDLSSVIRIIIFYRPLRKWESPPKKKMRVPWTVRRTNQYILNKSWILTGRNDAEAEVPVFWSPDANSWLIGKVPFTGKDWWQKEERALEEEMVGRHHWCNGYELGQTPGDGEWQGGLAVLCQ